MKFKKAHILLCSLFLAITPIVTAYVSGATASAAVPRLVFPVIGPVSYSDDFNAPRPNGPHHAIDIIADKGRKLVSAVDGVVTYVAYPQPSWGYMITIRDAANNKYSYIHINNDNPGTDDGRGGGMNAYAPDMRVGNVVKRGQHIGWVGDSGNAENTVSHLHFEIEAPNGSPINPYNYLRAAQKISSPVRYPALAGEILPYGNAYSGAINIAAGNADVDIQSEYVVGPGEGGGPHVKLFDHTDAQLSGGFFAYDPAFKGGVDVAMADTNGDGESEIITGAGVGGEPVVRIFSKTGTLIDEFMAYRAGVKNGLRVTAADIDGDNNAEIITSLGGGASPHVKFFKADGTEVASFFAFSTAFKGGVDVAAGDLSGTTDAEIVIAAGPGSTHIKIFNSSAQQLTGFMSHPGFNHGMRVSVGNVLPASAKSEIITSPVAKGTPQSKIFDGTGTYLYDKTFLESWWVGGYDVAAGYDTSKVAAGGGRRATIRLGIE
ncbi:MAG TPA: M23 family metallopeptidase [Candidatus Saccharimonadales bacterium]